jgi:hypothetical protein
MSAVIYPTYPTYLTYLLICIPPVHVRGSRAFSVGLGRANGNQHMEGIG